MGDRLCFNGEKVSIYRARNPIYVDDSLIALCTQTRKPNLELSGQRGPIYDDVLHAIFSAL
jgi:hypothetical protein